MTLPLAVTLTTLTALILGIALAGLITLFDDCTEEAHAYKLGAGRSSAPSSCAPAGRADGRTTVGAGSLPAGTRERSEA